MILYFECSNVRVSTGARPIDVGVASAGLKRWC